MTWPQAFHDVGVAFAVAIGFIALLIMLPRP